MVPCWIWWVVFLVRGVCRRQHMRYRFGTGIGIQTHMVAITLWGRALRYSGAPVPYAARSSLLIFSTRDKIERAREQIRFLSVFPSGASTNLPRRAIQKLHV